MKTLTLVLVVATCGVGFSAPCHKPLRDREGKNGALREEFVLDKKAKNGNPAEANATPVLDSRQKHMEEKIDFGARSGRLSTGEANSLKRKLERLYSLEDRMKAKEQLSTRDREKMFAEANELRRELHKKLID